MCKCSCLHLPCVYRWLLWTPKAGKALTAVRCQVLYIVLCKAPLIWVSTGATGPHNLLVKCWNHELHPFFFWIEQPTPTFLCMHWQEMGCNALQLHLVYEVWEAKTNKQQSCNKVMMLCFYQGSNCNHTGGGLWSLSLLVNCCSYSHWYNWSGQNIINTPQHEANQFCSSANCSLHNYQYFESTPLRNTFNKHYNLHEGGIYYRVFY